ncbi:hypothetical protein QTN25_005523 [Entamoeba marina]
MSNKLFQKIDTQFLYSPEDILLEGIKQYQFCYQVNYTQTHQEKDNYIFKHVAFDQQSYDLYGEKVLLQCNTMKIYNFHKLNEVVVPTHVTSLQYHNEYHSTTPTSIVFHDNIIRFYPQCFKSFSKVKSFTLPTMLKTLEFGLFSNCTSLSSIHIPQSVERIDGTCFQSCNSLSSVVFDCEIDLIPSFCFKGCSSLKTISIPTNVTSIGESAFSGCLHLESIKIGTKVENISKNCFLDCRSFQKIIVVDENNKPNNTFTIPTSVTSLQNSCFSNCSKLINVVIPSSIIELPKECFKGCYSLLSITIPTTITSIEEKCFEGTVRLSKIDLPTSLKYIGKRVFGSITSITIPSSVKGLSEEMFYDCSMLESLTVHKNINTIPRMCFYNCSKLTKIHVLGYLTKPRPTTSYLSINPLKALKIMRSIVIPTSLTHFGEQSFGNDQGVNYVKTPDGIHIFSKDLLSHSTTLTIPTTMTFLNNNCFNRCRELKNITFDREPNNLVILSPCTSITSVTIKNATQLTCVTPFFISQLLAKKNISCTNLSLQPLDIDIIAKESPESVGVVGYKNKSRKIIQHFNVEDNVKCLLDSCFQSCICLTTIKLSTSLTNIGENCFGNCIFLNNVSIPNGITCIPNNCFSNCSRLQEINIPTTVTEIGYGAFQQCYKLKQIIIPHVEKLGNNCFDDCFALTRIVIKRESDKNTFPFNTPKDCFEYVD